VAPDLAPVFAETPWLDTPPGNDGQADMLARLGSIKPPAFETALQRLRPATPAQAADVRFAQPRPAGAAGSLEAKRFLLRVMNDDTVAMALRIEAARALLPCADETQPPQDR